MNHHRFPELGRAWREHAPDRYHPVMTEVLAKLVEQGRLRIPDIEVAIVQLYALILYPHLVYGAYGTAIDGDLTDRLITGGIEMFLTYYATDEV